ncbi:MAG: PIG-L deacetylase family protein [Aggregatilineales bacterium]
MASNAQTSKRIMGIFAHPDDPEFFCGATFARWAREGADITFVLATSGDKGSSDPLMTSEKLTEIREEEERRSAAVLGVQEVVFLRYPDGELEPSAELRRDLARLIRLKQPDIVVTCDPTSWYDDTHINHPDHRAIGEAALAAVYPIARDRLNFIELERDEGLPTHKVRQVYIAGAVQPTRKIDVTAYIETQIAALQEHRSQIADIERVATRLRERKLDPEAPEDSPRYVESFKVITLG